MAEKKTDITFESIMRDLEQKKYAPAYILMGEESYFIDRITDFIATNVLDESERDFNQDIVYGLETTPNQVILMARGYPMMAEHRVVIVKEAQSMPNLGSMKAYFEGKMQPTTILVICHKNDKIKGKSDLLKAAERSGAVVFESKKLYDSKLKPFIQNYIKTKKATIDAKSVDMLADSIGSDLNRLLSEIDKLLSLLPDDNKRITPELVEKHIGLSKDFNRYELRNAVINRDILKANQIVKYFDKNPKTGSIYSILPDLYGFFSNLMVAHYAPRKNTQKDIAQFLELEREWSARDYMMGMKNFSALKTMQIIQKLHEMAAKSKGVGSREDAGLLMKELIFFILH